VPFEEVVAFLVFVVLFGSTIMNRTVAPDAAAPPYVTLALIETGSLLAYVADPTLTVAERMPFDGGGGAITVRLALPEAEAPVSAADAFTPYVPAAVPAGTDLVMVTEPD
jgi:hypothetical protein